jgi:Ni/Co efflux regulator RcnB
MQVLTFGHSTAAAEKIVRLLRGAEVRRVVDVRTAPVSRHNPDATREAMSRWLPQVGISYQWDKRLGGWRKAPADSHDTALRNQSFCGYAAHMRSSEFLAAIEDLLAGARGERTAVMCAESVWWRCHRKMIDDFLMVARSVEVPAAGQHWVGSASEGVMVTSAMRVRSRRLRSLSLVVSAAHNTGRSVTVAASYSGLGGSGWAWDCAARAALAWASSASAVSHRVSRLRATRRFSGSQARNAGSARAAV